MRRRPELMLVGGDVTRDGHYHDFEFEEMRQSLDTMNIPYRAIPGNMDTGNKPTDKQGARTDRDDIGLNVTSEQLQRFGRYFGESPWSFIYKNVRFSGFYEAVAGSELPEEKRMWQWLSDLEKLPSAQHHVMINHYPLFIDYIDEPTFDIADPKTYSVGYFGIDSPHRKRILEAFKAAKVNIIFSGHIHCRRPVQIADGIRFYKSPATSFSQWDDHWEDGDPTLGFYHCHVTNETINFWDLMEGVPGIRPHRPPKGSGNTMGGWYNSVGLYKPEELGGLSVTSYIQALQKEGVDIRHGINRPLHLHPLLQTCDVYGLGKPTVVAHKEGKEMAVPSLPISESIRGRCIGVPNFKKFYPPVIEQYVTAFRKVSNNYRALLQTDPGNPADYNGWSFADSHNERLI